MISGGSRYETNIWESNIGIEDMQIYVATITNLSIPSVAFIVMLEL